MSSLSVRKLRDVTVVAGFKLLTRAFVGRKSHLRFGLTPGGVLDVKHPCEIQENFRASCVRGYQKSRVRIRVRIDICVFFVCGDLVQAVLVRA